LGPNGELTENKEKRKGSGSCYISLLDLREKGEKEKKKRLLFKTGDSVDSRKIKTSKGGEGAPWGGGGRGVERRTGSSRGGTQRGVPGMICTSIWTRRRERGGKAWGGARSSLLRGRRGKRKPRKRRRAETDSSPGIGRDVIMGVLSLVDASLGLLAGS